MATMVSFGMHTGVKGLWAVRFRPEGLPWEPDFAFHAFLLLTVGQKTIVLQTGEELSEMQAAQVDFVLDKPTLLAANLLSWARTVQVGAFLLSQTDWKRPLTSFHGKRSQHL